MVKKTLAWGVLATFMPAYVGSIAAPRYGPVRQWLAGAAVLGVAGAVGWAVQEVGSE